MSFEYFEWIVLGLVAWGIGVMFVLILMRMSADQDRNALRAQHRMIPHADGTITSISW